MARFGTLLGFAGIPGYLAVVLVRFDHVASVVANADHGIVAQVSLRENAYAGSPSASIA